jgi:N-formylglutamate amidohydrolase
MALRRAFPVPDRPLEQRSPDEQTPAERAAYIADIITRQFNPDPEQIAHLIQIEIERFAFPREVR